MTVIIAVRQPSRIATHA